MIFEKPSGPRHTVTETSDGIAICIPSQRNIFLLAFLTVWLCGWIVGEGTLLTTAEEDPAFTFVLLCVWTLGGALAMAGWLWQLNGCEVITVSPAIISIRRQVFGYGFTKHFDASAVRQMRVAPIAYNPFDFRSGMAFWGFGRGLVAFDYGFKTFRFGGGVEEPEARLIVKTVTDRVPALNRT